MPVRLFRFRRKTVLCSSCSDAVVMCSKSVLCLFLCLKFVTCQFGFFPNQDDGRYGSQFNFQNFFPQSKRLHRLTGLLHFDQNNQNNNQDYIYPFNRRPITTENQYNYDRYGRPIQYPNGNQNQQFNNQQYDQNQFTFGPVQEPPQGNYPNDANNNGLIVVDDNQNNYNQNNPVTEDPVHFDAPNEPKAQETFSDRNAEVAETTKAPENTELPVLQPVPDSEKRNNFNFGSEGLFRETCETVEGDIGSCISVYECSPYIKLLSESQTNPKIVEVLRKAHCGFDGNRPKVCCPRPGFTESPPPEPTSPHTPEPTASGKTAQPENYIATFPEPPECGFSNASFSRVVNGIDAKLGDFPWMVLLGYKSKRNPTTSWLCGGSLITHRHVLTAAHCIHGHETDLYVVRVGELDLAREDEGATPADVLIQSKIKHEEYDPKAFTNDIGLLVLDTDVPFTALIKPICIPRTTQLRTKNFEDYMPLIAGWGKTEFRGPSATHLQALQLPVVSNKECAEAYAPYKLQKIDERVICAGYKNGGRDACQGDSGGPLMQPIYDTVEYTTYFYQTGVVSFGKECARAGFPGVYTRVTEFVPWLEEKVLSAGR